MAKYDEREGNSCHIHLSLRGTDGGIVFADDDREGGRSELFDQFLAMAEAAAAGLGAALLPDFLAEREIRAGRLVQIGPEARDPAARYWLVWPEETQPKPSLQLFIATMKAVAA